MTPSEKIIQHLFPKENFILERHGVYVAESRKIKNKREEEILEKEIAQAGLLADNGYTVYLVPENDSTKKNFDAIVDGRTTEFKYITGNIRTLGKAYKEALKQGQDVFIRTEGKKLSEIYSKLLGETKTLMQNNAKINKNGFLYIWINEEKKLHKWSIKEIIRCFK